MGISNDYYEAALMDGATKWQQIKYITLPSLKSMMIVLTILAIGKIFYADFGLFYQLPRNSGPLFPVTNVIDTYVYRSLKTGISEWLLRLTCTSLLSVSCLCFLRTSLSVRLTRTAHYFKEARYVKIIGYKS